MVEKVDDFDIVLVDGELEALILECNLIKKHMPWYNILLKDDKHYPFIRIDLREPFPAVELRREQVKDGARYFGPYVGAAAVREVLDISRMLFPIRHCTKPLKPGMKARPCLHHQVGQCLAPCAGLVDEATYGAEIKKLIHFLSGHYDDVLKELKSRMAEAAAAMNYERAAVYRDRIRAVNDLMQRQKALDVGGEDRDIIAELPVDADVLVQVMLTRGGRLISSEMFTLSRAADDEPGEVLTRFMTQYYSAENPPAPEVLVSAPLPESAVLEELLGEIIHRRVRISCPQRGRQGEAGADGAQEPARRSLEDREKARPQPRAHDRRFGGASGRTRPARAAPAHRGLRYFEHAGRSVRGERGRDDRRRERAQGVPALSHPRHRGAERL